jgi:CDP-diacylglycerol---serine O-phosphatidyltransferase
MQKIIKQIPNIFTLLNLFFGCIAIVYALQNTLDVSFDSSGYLRTIFLKEEIYLASLFIAIAAVVDFLDGFVARLLGAASELGKQLDSLADVVSFGVAPSIIMYQLLRYSFIQQNEGLETSLLFLTPAFLLACAGAYRLGRFNLDATQTQGFKGVPIPAAGLLIASLPLIYWHTPQNAPWLRDVLINQWFLYAVIVIVSVLMVSKLPLMALKFNSFAVAQNKAKYGLVLGSIVAAIVFKWLAVPIVFVAYIVLSLLNNRKKI